MSKLQSSHYKNVSTDPVGTGRGSFGIRGAHFGNHRLRFSVLIHTASVMAKVC